MLHHLDQSCKISERIHLCLFFTALCTSAECVGLVPSTHSTHSFRRLQPLLARSVHDLKPVGSAMIASISLHGGLSSATARDWLARTSDRTPPSDVYQQRNADFAMRARTELPVVNTVPDDFFLREVLPYQHFDEPIDEWRPDFFEKLRHHVANASTLTEIAETVIPLVFNGHLGNNVTFKANMTPQVMAPVSETLRLGHASCTGLSILLANALRSVGVPARIAGIAEWNRPDGGNHNWVEIWTGDAWHFVDAVPVSQVVWDTPWFANGLVQKSVAGGIHGVYTPVWDASDADANYTVTWRSPSLLMPALDRTAFYQSVPSEACSGQGCFEH